MDNNMQNTGRETTRKMPAHPSTALQLAAIKAATDPDNPEASRQTTRLWPCCACCIDAACEKDGTHVSRCKTCQPSSAARETTLNG